MAKLTIRGNAGSPPVWPIAGPPDVTFFNPSSGLVHVAIGEPGLVDSIDPRTGHGTRTVDRRGRAHDGAGGAGPALRDFTRARRNPRPLGRLTAADPKAGLEA